jgi:hypothetical protein
MNNNPYTVLDISPDADRKEIMDAQKNAMIEKKYSLTEIHSAMRQLLDPAKRLAVDFMYPAKIKAKKPPKITIDIAVAGLKVDDISDDSFDSLK